MGSRLRVYIFIVTAIILSIGAYVYITFFMPSFEKVDLNAYYGVNGDRVAIFYNDGLQKTSAIKKAEEIYIPADWASTILNDKFYVDTEENLLVYTLPEEIIYMDEDYDFEGQRAFIKEEGNVYISMDLISKYTDIHTREFLSEDIKKLYIYDMPRTFIKAELKKKIKLREADTIKADIVVDLEKEESIYIVSQNLSAASLMEDSSWVKVVSAEGDTGYISSKVLQKFEDIPVDNSFVEPIYNSLSLGEPVVLGWQQVSNQDANKNLDGLLTNAKGLNVISPTWFALSDNEGNYTSYASKEYVDKAHSMGIQVWALIDNLSDDVSSVKLLKKSSLRKKLIEKLIADAKEYNIDGINLDFEGLNEEAARYYLQFIREISVYTRREGLILSVDVPNYAAYNTFYKRDKQAEVADYIINMAYDEHYVGSDMGSVASIGFVKEGVEKSLEEVPAHKLINAIPVYTRLWTKSGNNLSSRALGIEAGLQWIEENNLKTVWQEDIGQYYAEMLSGNESQHMWLEDEKSLKLKLELNKKYALAGVAVWRLGLETPSVWDIIAEYK